MARETKKEARLRRAKRARLKIKELQGYRLSVHRSSQHLYAQVLDASGLVKASASTVEPAIRAMKSDNMILAAEVGKLIAERLKAQGMTKVSFDRSGFKYHGRVKAFAEAARANGLEF
jgi:large subunit ribosomal protein L18